MGAGSWIQSNEIRKEYTTHIEHLLGRYFMYFYIIVNTEVKASLTKP